ncbi:hypothetical protein SAMN04488498_11587 [Mesorhizobium albiziae]|uniref:Glutamine cyclotransferase n=1 Tax=Neomesorhizobium albiziae TaxID=335020 RepID=A0A1I4D4U2_9HYPH|nr:hypothetical protein [Mesorhizobium albiziae]SFK87166.1 hypothetical protein SAMN04488498_11587 [Mesorhizobium albiziae]
MTTDAGTAFDGEHLWQIAEDRINQIRLLDGNIVRSIPAPGHGGDSGLAWAEGFLWVGQHLGKVIQQVDPSDGSVLNTIQSTPS